MWYLPESSSLRECNWSSSKIHCSCCERGQLAAAAEILNVNGAQLLLLLLLPPQPQALSRLVFNLCLLAEEGGNMMKPILRQQLPRTTFLFVCRGCVQNQFWRHFVLTGMIGTKSFTFICWWQTHFTPYKVQGSVLPHNHTNTNTFHKVHCSVQPCTHKHKSTQPHKHQDVTMLHIPDSTKCKVLSSTTNASDVTARLFSLRTTSLET